MEKELYHFLFIRIIEWDTQDIVTGSTADSEEGDDLGGWNSSWFANN